MTAHATDGDGSGPESNDVPAAVAGARLVPMAKSDLEQVLRIESVSFGTPWLREHFEYEIRHRGSPSGTGEQRVADVLRHRGRVAGYVCAWFSFGELKINNIAVVPELRGRGIGRWLLRDLLDRARDVGCKRACLEVRPSNRPARDLYRSEGFFESGRRHNYYQREREDAVVMELELRPRI